MKTSQIIRSKGIKLTAFQERIIKQLDKIGNGNTCTVVYKSDCTRYLKAEAKRNLLKVEKISIIPVTKGIDYSHKKAVIEKRQQEILQWGFYNTKESSYEKYDNSFAKNKKSDQYYLLFGPQPNKNAKSISEYIINGDETKKYTAQEIKEMGIFQDSYWNKKSTETLFYTLKLEGILAIM